MPRFCQTLNLKDDAHLIAEYKKYHQNVWPDIRDFIRSAGILSMEIYCYQTRLVMVMETDGDFSFERMDELSKNNSKVQEWEDLMSNFQEPLAGVAQGTKWVLMERIY
ncbi:MAG TPA: L-rhamnose mutarotase [Cytophagaceae bacterium]|jgi:L-rhamnose mutarotase